MADLLKDFVASVEPYLEPYDIDEESPQDWEIEDLVDLISCAQNTLLHVMGGVNHLVCGIRHLREKVVQQDKEIQHLRDTIAEKDEEIHDLQCRIERYQEDNVGGN